MKKTLFWTLILGVALCSPAFAQGKGHGKGNSKAKANPHSAQRNDDRDHDRDQGRWESRGGWDYRTYDRGQTPPGWSKGKKTGWGNCNLPPGQAKKSGCNQYRYQGRDYYWYRDDVGRIIVRRPTISAHAGVDIH